MPGVLLRALVRESRSHQAINDMQPEKIDIGAVFSFPPKLHKSPNASTQQHSLSRFAELQKSAGECHRISNVMDFVEVGNSQLPLGVLLPNYQ